MSPCVNVMLDSKASYLPGTFLFGEAEALNAHAFSVCIWTFVEHVDGCSIHDSLWKTVPIIDWSLTEELLSDS